MKNKANHNKYYAFKYSWKKTIYGVLVLSITMRNLVYFVLENASYDPLHLKKCINGTAMKVCIVQSLYIKSNAQIFTKVPCRLLLFEFSGQN